MKNGTPPRCGIRIALDDALRSKLVRALLPQILAQLPKKCSHRNIEARLIALEAVQIAFLNCAKNYAALRRQLVQQGRLVQALILCVLGVPP